jgi:hypothetical protein
VILVCEHNELKADHTSAILYLAWMDCLLFLWIC